MARKKKDSHERRPEHNLTSVAKQRPGPWLGGMCATARERRKVSNPGEKREVQIK